MKVDLIYNEVIAQGLVKAAWNVEPRSFRDWLSLIAM